MSETGRRAEFGDFQTPPDLAAEILNLLQGLRPASLVEPSCGVGNLFVPAIAGLSSLERALAIEINAKYASALKTRLDPSWSAVTVDVRTADFFVVDWERELAALPQPVLLLGNPPWVTNAELGRLGSSNVPAKSNFHRLTGLSAKTGKSNFDISEWLLLRLTTAMSGKSGLLAMLCKTSVARKTLVHAWKSKVPLTSAEIFRIDAAKHFGASVDACLLLMAFNPSALPSSECTVFASLDRESAHTRFGYRDDRLVADLILYDSWRHLAGPSRLQWRSGIKHDCSPVMELAQVDGSFRNGLGETVDIELDYLYPMLKCTDLARDYDSSQRYMLVPQRSVGEDTSVIRHLAPQTWQYLVDHGHLLDRRASSIYKSKPRFAVFGVGDYSFHPWKVAVSGLHHDLRFRLVSERKGRPVVFDDTCYAIGLAGAEAATLLFKLLNTEPAQLFLRSLVFDDSKRPVTVDVLGTLDLLALAQECGQQPGFVANILESSGARSLSLQHSLL